MNYLSIILLFFLIGTIEVSACDCKPRKSITDAYNYSKSVIIGRILSVQQVVINESAIEDYNPGIKGILGERWMRYTLVVEETIKGIFTTDTVEVYTGLGVADCGFGFKVNEKYIVYGIDGKYNNTTFTIANKSLWTTVCSRTKLSDEKEIEQLRLLAK